jgi:hypothetical protein
VFLRGILSMPMACILNYVIVERGMTKLDSIKTSESLSDKYLAAAMQ